MELVAHDSAEAFASVCYAPGMNTPLDINIKSDVKQHTDAYQFFDFTEMHKLIQCNYLDYDLLRLGTFNNLALEFNKVKKQNEVL
jgi:hypothetical protein